MIRKWPAWKSYTLIGGVSAGAYPLILLAVLALAGCAPYDMGGNVHEYSMKYHAMQQAGIPPRLSGDCGSACTLGLRDPAACYEPDARLHFHGVSRNGKYDAKASAAFRDAMPEGVRQWADSTGAFNSTEVVSISGRDLAAYDGRVCS